jgi:hypothetical protein
MDITDYGLGMDKAAQEQPSMVAGGRIHRPNLTERLEMQIKEHESQLARLKEAHAELKKNPGIEHLLNLLQRI